MSDQVVRAILDPEALSARTQNPNNIPGFPAENPKLQPGRISGAARSAGFIKAEVLFRFQVKQNRFLVQKPYEDVRGCGSAILECQSKVSDTHHPGQTYVTGAKKTR